MTTGKSSRASKASWASPGTQWVAGDYVINIITSHKPHYLVEIKDAVMAENLREMLKGMWETA